MATVVAHLPESLPTDTGASCTSLALLSVAELLVRRLLAVSVFPTDVVAPAGVGFNLSGVPLLVAPALFLMGVLALPGVVVRGWLVRVELDIPPTPFAAVDDSACSGFQIFMTAYWNM